MPRGRSNLYKASICSSFVFRYPQIQETEREIAAYSAAISALEKEAEASPLGEEELAAALAAAAASEAASKRQVTKH